MVMVFSQQWNTEQDSKYDWSQGPRGVRSEGKEERDRERGKEREAVGGAVSTRRG